MPKFDLEDTPRNLKQHESSIQKHLKEVEVANLKINAKPLFSSE